MKTLTSRQNIGSCMVAAPPPPNFLGDKKIKAKKNGGEPEQKNEIWGAAKFKGGLWTPIMSWLLCQKILFYID